MAAIPRYQNLRCIIVGKNLENGVERFFDVRDGAIFVENKNEELDSGTIVVPQVESEIDIEPYDEIIIHGHRLEIRNMLVDSYTCTQTCLYPPMYRYEISLMSKTKLLEGMLCPSLAITRVESNPRSVWYYLDQYLKEYCTRANVNASGSFTTTLSYNARVSTKFNSIECPELQWNEPTLREVLTDLMLVADCIPVVKGNEIDYIDLTSSGVDITTNAEIMKNINYITSSQSSADFVSELKVPMVNSIGTDEVTKICENITFRNSESYILTTENVRLETSHPIYNIKDGKITIILETQTRFTNLNTTEQVIVDTDAPLTQDITQFILEFGEWQTKNIYYGSFNNTQPLSTNYQNTCLYFKRGERNVYNFESKQDSKFLWINNQVSVLELLINYVKSQFSDAQKKAIAEQQAKKDYPQYDNANWSCTSLVPSVSNWKKTMFYLEYETVGNHLLFASKGGLSKNKRQVVDNQTNSYVSAKRQGILEYAKANRLGNKIKCINGRFAVKTTTPLFGLYYESDLPNIGDKFGNSIIFKREIAAYKNYIKVNYYATENYVLKNYFTGIKSKARSWKILDGNEAFIRADNIKIYINPNEMENVSDANGYKIPVYNTLNEYFNDLNYCLVRFKEPNSASYLPKANEMLYKNVNYGCAWYQMEMQKIISGNSLLITIRCKDNAIVGKYIDDNNHDIGSGVKAMTQKNCKYVDDNGENDGGIISFRKTYSMDNALNGTYREAYSNLFPATDGWCYGSEIMRIPFKFHKDNKEITQITIQIELNEDANDMFIGKK